jgi:hypothetical protein
MSSLTDRYIKTYKAKPLQQPIITLLKEAPASTPQGPEFSLLLSAPCPGQRPDWSQ